MLRCAFGLFATLLLPCAGAWASSSALSPEEQQKQEEFKKKFVSQEKRERESAFSLLEGAKHPSSWQLISTALNSEKENSVKQAGFAVLSKMPARDPSLARVLAMHFKAVKFNDTELRLEYCAAMNNSEFKFDILEAMVEYLGKLRYPNIPALTNNTGGGGGGGGMAGGIGINNGNSNNNANAIENAKRQRKEFEDFLQAFNVSSQSDIKPSQNAPMQIKKWWDVNAAKFATSDQALTEKYRKADEKK